MEVRLSPYREEWAERFREEADYLSGLFGPLAVSFEHFGSTAVPGMRAKPVVDMMVIVTDIAAIDGLSGTMAALGYDVAGEWGIPGRRLFRKGGADRTHHIHVYEAGNPHIERHLVVRDYLRGNPEEAARYSDFKAELAGRFKETSGYSPAKKAFVSELERTALAWHAERRADGNGNGRS